MSGQLATEPCGEHITAERETDLTTTNGQKRFLMEECGLTRSQAARTLVAWKRDQERPVVTAAETYTTDFLTWLMKAPSDRKPTVRKWRIGEGNWRTR